MKRQTWRTPAKEKTQIADVPKMKTCAAKFVCVLMLVGAVLPLAAQSGDEEGSRSKVLALERAWNQAEAFNDLKALDALFDNRLVYVDFDGTLKSKAEFLLGVKAAHMQQVITESMAVQIFGDAAIVTGTYHSKEFKDGKPLVRRGRFVDTWVQKDQTWVCVAAQATPISR
jgi:ketosteroid isomerase-like protein